jgi:hypothetical protein
VQREGPTPKRVGDFVVGIFFCIKVHGNRISGSHLAGITLGGGEARNGGVNATSVEKNDLRGNAKPIWRQNNVAGDVIIRNIKL